MDEKKNTSNYSNYTKLVLNYYYLHEKSYLQKKNPVTFKKYIY